MFVSPKKSESYHTGVSSKYEGLFTPMSYSELANKNADNNV